MKNSKKCPECGSRRIYTKKVSVLNGGYGPDLLPGVGGLFKGRKFQLYICGDCGLTKFYVPEEYRPDLEKKFEKLNSF